MEDSISISKARARLLELPKTMAKSRATKAVALTRRGKPVLALMSWGLYESIMETMEIMSDPDLMKDLRKSLKELSSGRTISWEKVKRGFKL